MQRPYGSWRSPISAAMVAAQGLRLGAVTLDGDDIYWLEGRPSEQGRTVLVRRAADGGAHDVTPPPFNVRTRVHEYGGGAYVVADGAAYFSNFSDQRLYRVAIHGDAPPVPLTPAGRWFFADAVIDRLRGRILCVREDHTDAEREAITTLVAIPLDSSEPNAGETIASGYDFYSSPRLSADAAHLCWICWRHPNMPWDGTELWVGDVDSHGALANARRVAGGDTESIYQPGWLPDGSLCFASDRDGWWRLYRFVLEAERTIPILRAPPERAEFGRPQWVFGSATWAIVDRDRLAVSFTREGRWHLGSVDLESGTVHASSTTLEPLEWLAATATHLVTVVASPATAEAVVRLELSSGQLDVLRSAAPQHSSNVGTPCDPAFLSSAEAIEFPSMDGRTAHAFYYRPCHPEVEGMPDEQPPLIVISHGGPTTATRDTLDLKIQFWTSRGFAVVDVNYRGSSGYGREYRQRLNGQWGIADVEDCIDAARFLAAQARADPRRLIIRGGSAGGYTALAALTFHPQVFRAGASYYGISDLEVLARDTHKFESRYLDTMVGRYPDRRDVYRARSPIHFVHRLSCALILFQGLEDKVVPPNQSAMMADAVRAKGLPVAYLTFAGEQHGFRRAETIVRSLEAELSFYARVFGFPLADAIDPPPIDNLVV